MAMGAAKAGEYFEHCLERQENGTLDIFIISHEGADSGYGLLNWKPKYAYFKQLGIPEIQDLNILRAHRRCGLAGALIDHCEALARAKGCKKIGISFGLSREYGPAQRLYIKKGYVPDGNGATYDRAIVAHGDFKPLDDNLCLMLTKKLV